MKHSFRPIALAGGLMLAAVPAFAQVQPQVDPRLAAPMVLALRAELSLSDAAIKALQEDAAKRQQELDAWFKGWFGAPEPAAK